jgi:hypothetical protein
MANLKSQSRTEYTVGGIDGIDANQYDRIGETTLHYTLNFSLAMNLKAQQGMPAMACVFA